LFPAIGDKFFLLVTPLFLDEFLKMVEKYLNT
jgi:hypothetical protein